VERRRFLQSVGLLALEPLLFGCEGEAKADRLRVRFLRGSLPIMLTGEFRKLQPKHPVEFKIFDQLAESAKQLTAWQQPIEVDRNWRLPWQAPPDRRPADLVTLGHGWLSAAVQQQALQPLDVSKLPNWSRLAPQWQQLGTINGKVWGAPYRWGSTILIYRRDRWQQLGIPAPTDWADLWQPALRGKVVLLNQQQEIIGLTLKKLGHSYRTDPQQVPELRTQLQALHGQTLFYSSDNYIAPLLNGDAVVAVGWSSDLATVLSRNPNLAVAIPKSGTSLWADLWVRPAGASVARKEVSDLWMDFCWQTLAATKISLQTGSLSPIWSNSKVPQFPPELANHLLINATERGEFLPILNAQQSRQYTELWQAMKA
jgi:putative spermidine/putrescine transport system substrate-binding protein